ncbi:hypothetical protein ASD78_17810 [Lysobacter sp. Root667]|uniref:hypothetical protein n=1 Tax=Lysobacter sp. Root667 TaxID=1736581 RepID=UPI0006FF2D65|nr:hypothetical protein [Lysobacter sp. Root667]KRA70691.1 hypothetical protein ASD78_17810 [Lysobacter sp. Root667]
MKLVTIAALIMIAASFQALAETPGELWRDGYSITWESSYEDVEECTPSTGVVLSDEFIFICDGYEYVYHYGAVFIASRSFTYNGRTLTTNYLCIEDEDECLSGTLVRKGR